MWGYQQIFRTTAEMRFKQLAEKIGVRITPKIFLVGIRSKTESGHRICVEPEDDFRYNQETFANFQQEYNRACASDPRAKIFQSHPIAQKIEKQNLHLRAFSKAVISAIEAQDGVGGYVTFSAAPVPIDIYEVCVVLQLPQKELDQCPTLVQSGRSITPYHNYPITRSLLRAAAQVFLAECSRDLWLPDVNDLTSNIEDMAREAGKLMMSGPSYLGEIGSALDCASLSEACNVISATQYEGTPSIGGMIISSQTHNAVKPSVVFVQPITLQDYRGIRKLLELALEGQSLLCDGRIIYGIGSINDSYDLSDEDIFQVQFIKHHTWELVHGRTALMLVEYGNPRVPSLPYDLPKFQRDLPRFFPEIRAEDIEHLSSIVLESCAQHHGTTVVISATAQQEAERLRGQATLIQPTPLTKELVRIVTSIDGGILLDPKGICYAIGVILDGQATPNGNPSRGGRYNSAVRYTEANPGTFCIVVSADATVDIVPNLRPQIPRRMVDDTLLDLTTLSRQEYVDSGDHNKVVSTLDKIRFYLTEEDCKQANELITAVRSKVNYSNGGIIVSTGDFIANPEMNASYYLDEKFKG